MSESMEFKSKLTSIATYILSDESEFLSENIDYMNRIKYIRNKLERAEKKAIDNITRTNWLSLDSVDRQNKYNEIISPCLLDCEDELIHIYFEMGIRCGYIFFQDLVNNENKYHDYVEEKKDDNPPTIAEIICKNPEHITYEEYMILPTWTDERVDDFRKKIPQEKKDFFGKIVTLNTRYKLLFNETHTELLQVIEPEITYDKNSYPEEIKKKKIDIDYIIFHRWSTKEWCKLNDIEFIENENLTR